jgi:hypothetical protein
MGTNGTIAAGLSFSAEDGQKVLLAIKSMGGESGEAWRTVLDKAIAAVWEACRSSGARSTSGDRNPPTDTRHQTDRSVN